MSKGFVYVLRSLKNNRFYIGSTTDIFERLKKHERGGVTATKYLRPLKLELFQQFDNFSIARKVEFKLKKFKRRDFLDKIVRDGMIKMGL